MYLDLIVAKVIIFENSPKISFFYLFLQEILMTQRAKTAKESLVSKTELILPNDTNTLNHLMGGRLMHWMDIVAGISGQKHCEAVVVTASVDNISFRAPIVIGSVVTLRAKATRAFNTSLEIRIDVDAENIIEGKKVMSNTAYFTFVALNSEGRPIQIPKVIPETKEEQELYDGALRRRQLRLVLSGRMKASEATELKSLFSM